MERKLFQKKDIFVFLGIILLVLIFLCFLPRETGKSAEIWVDGKLWRSYPLNEAFVAEPIKNVKIVGDGERACFEASDCPDKICVNTGKLTLSGQWASCLPNGVVLKIVKGDGVDTVN